MAIFLQDLVCNTDNNVVYVETTDFFLILYVLEALQVEAGMTYGFHSGTIGNTGHQYCGIEPKQYFLLDHLLTRAYMMLPNP